MSARIALFLAFAAHCHAWAVTPPVPAPGCGGRISAVEELWSPQTARPIAIAGSKTTKWLGTLEKSLLASTLPLVSRVDADLQYRIGVGNSRDVLREISLGRTNPDATWARVTMGYNRARLPAPRDVVYSAPATNEFWKVFGATIRQTSKSRSGAFLRSLLAGNLAALRVMEAEGNRDNTAAAAWNLLVKYNDVRDQSLGQFYDTADLSAVSHILFETLRIWFAASGVTVVERAAPVKTDNEVPWDRYFIVEAEGESSLARALRTVRQRSTYEDLTFALIPGHVVRMEHSGALRGSQLALSLSRLMGMADEPRAVDSTLHTLRVARRLSRELPTAYMGRFFTAGGNFVNATGFDLPGSLSTLHATQYVRMLLDRDPLPLPERNLAFGVASLVAQSERAFGTLRENLRETQQALGSAETALAERRTVTLIRRDVESTTVGYWFLRVEDRTRPFTAVVLERRGDGSRILHFYGPRTREHADFGMALDVFDATTTKAIAQAEVRWATEEPSSDEAADFLEIVVAYARRRVDLSLAAVEFNLTTLSETARDCEAFILQGDRAAFARIGPDLDRIEAYPLNKASLADARTPAAELVATTLPPGRDERLNVFHQAMLEDAMTNGGARAAISETISVQVVLRHAQRLGWVVRNRSRDLKSYDLELVDQRGNIVAVVEVKGVNLDGSGQPEFEMPESEMRVARGSPVPWFLAVVAFSREGSTLHVFAKRDWRLPEAGERARVYGYQDFVAGTPTAELPRNLGL